MNSRRRSTLLMIVALLLALYLCACLRNGPNTIGSVSPLERKVPLRMAISPYQDTAFLVNAKPLELEKKYGVKLELLTFPWEETLPAIASVGETVDVSYANLTEYLTKSVNLNGQRDDPVLFIYPAYVFNGGGFITFNPEVPDINSQTIKNPSLVRKFLSFRKRLSISLTLQALPAKRVSIGNDNETLIQ